LTKPIRGVGAGLAFFLLVAGASLAACGSSADHDETSKAGLESQPTVGQALTFCKGHPWARGRKVRVRGYYLEYPVPSAAPDEFAELFGSSGGGEGLLKNTPPSRITTGIALVVPGFGENAVHVVPRTRSWVITLGRLSCYDGTHPAQIIVDKFVEG
jgi:hypothetical protein